jgi:hypothetical protein
MSRHSGSISEHNSRQRPVPKGRSDSMAKWSPDNPNHPYVERGYNPKFAISIRNINIKDKCGEESYQRELLRAAETRSRRVPDPSLFPNSPSAIAFVKRREEGIFRPRNHHPLNNDRDPDTPSSTRTSSYSPNYLPEPSLNDRQVFPSQIVDNRSDYEMGPRLREFAPNNRSLQNGSAHPMGLPDHRHRHHTSHDQPMILEPSNGVAPAGPLKIHDMFKPTF